MLNHPSALFAVLFAAMSLMLGSGAQAQDPLKVEEFEEEVVDNVAEFGRRPKSGNWVWMPIPVLNPTLDAGLALTVLRLYKLHPESPSSTTGGAGFGTSNGSFGGGLFTQNYLRRDRLRLTGGLGYADLNLNFYGFGNNARSLDRLKINQKGTVGFAQSLWRMREHLYGGVRLRYLSLTSALRFLPDEGSFGNVPPAALLDLGLELDSIGPGVKLVWDSRDDTWFPTTGHKAEFSLDTSMTGLGSDRDYQIYQLTWSSYWSVNESDVLGVNATACDASKKAPFYDICLLGSGKNMRGFESGRYRDNKMFTAQVEYRKQLTPRWGAVVFGGVGQVANRWSGFETENWRTSAGFGVRWIASPEHGVRLSVDLAWGDGDNAAYFYIGEAF